jgi:serine phosphatase RsbU (regulator of sigma subunit)/pSer/pThr/pTyr-binding forkhead associated (FHA) protein
MGFLVILKGPNAGRQLPLDRGETILGRQTDAHVCLESQAVSRHHARILLDNGNFFVEDLHSSNGTFLNGQRIRGRVPFTREDVLQIGPYSLGVRPEQSSKLTDTDLVIREQVNADPARLTVGGDDAANKLQVVLEITQHLGRTLDQETLLGKLLDHLMRLFPQTDRGIVLLCDGDRFIVAAQRYRGPEVSATIPFSRTVVRRVLEDGVGILSEDVRADQRFQASSTLTSLDLRSLLCVPLIGHAGRRLGVLQLDCSRIGRSFRVGDLELVTAVGLQVAVVLENASLHVELLHKERLRQELALARDIQQGFLPKEFPVHQARGYDLFGGVYSAREVSGDFYDFLPVGDNRLAFFVGDVSGKGIPAALFMVAVRTLCRHLAHESQSPAETLRRLNPALAADNPSAMFVTLAHGIYDGTTGEVVLASGGHPAPLLREANGRVQPLPLTCGRLIGFDTGDKADDLGLADYRFTLQPGETLVLYTDGFTEARVPGTDNLFGIKRLQEVLESLHAQLPLELCSEVARSAVERFTQTSELQDDLTLFLLRRTSAATGG